MADHVALARRRREDVEARGAWWRCGRATGALCATSGENAGEDGEGHPVRRHSGGIESHVVDPASIATSRRHRRAKTDRIDGEALVRALLAYRRGEPRVCAMVKAPTPRKRTVAASAATLISLLGRLEFRTTISAYRMPPDMPRRPCGWHPTPRLSACRDPSPPASCRTSADRPSTGTGPCWR